MKKLLLFLCFIFVSLAGFAKNDFLPISNQVLTGDTLVMCNVSACSGDVFTFNIPSFLGFTTSCSYFCDGIRYNTTEPYILIPISSTISDTTIVCYIGIREYLSSAIALCMAAWSSGQHGFQDSLSESWSGNWLLHCLLLSPQWARAGHLVE